MTVCIGLEVLLADQLDLVRGKRVGLIASPSSVDSNLISTIERLYRTPEVELSALFGPEHGIRGAAQAGDKVGSEVDHLTGLSVYSLYGETRKPTSLMLENIDVLIYDLQECGLRFYTYLSTLAYAMRAAAEASIPLIVLDRPNPLTGLIVEGGILDNAYRSFVGAYPIPIRHGLTAGEIAGYLNSTHAIGCDLHVVLMEGWRRSMWMDETGLPFVPPSPNLPTLSALSVYPGTCLFEGTNMSEGRGTTKPFEYIGAPWIDADTLVAEFKHRELPGVRFRPVYFIPMFSKYAHGVCAGIQIYVTDREVFRPVLTALTMLAELQLRYPDQLTFLTRSDEGQRSILDLLSGSSKLRTQLATGIPLNALLHEWQVDQDRFITEREAFLLYL